jgi:hypothetical protein
MHAHDRRRGVPVEIAPRPPFQQWTAILLAAAACQCPGDAREFFAEDRNRPQGEQFVVTQYDCNVHHAAVGEHLCGGLLAVRVGQAQRTLIGKGGKSVPCPIQ